MNLIGLDIGTTTICGVLYSLKEKKAIKTLVKENIFVKDHQNEYIQDPLLILEKIYLIIDELIEFSHLRIGGISLSSQMHGILYVDEGGQPASSFYTWQNPRGAKPVGNRTLAAEVSEKLGYPVHSGYGIVTHCSLMTDKKLPNNAVKFCNIGDFVAMRLSGNKTPVTDITLGASMGIADIQSGSLAESLRYLELKDMHVLPRIVSSTEILGYYKEIPVVQPIGDNQASFLGSVKEKDKSLLLNYGTAGQISFYRDDYHAYPHFETRPLGNEGYIYAAFSLSGGKSYMILADFFSAVVKLFSSGDPLKPIQVMDELVLDFSRKDIECLPLFLGERGVEGNFAYFNHITDQNFTPENMVKALVQGMAFELYRHYEVLPEEVKQHLSILVGAGNGIRKNKHLIAAAKNLYHMPVKLLDLSEESCIGAVINAGKGAGIFRDYAEAAADMVTYKE